MMRMGRPLEIVGELYYSYSFSSQYSWQSELWGVFPLSLRERVRGVGECFAK